MADEKKGKRIFVYDSKEFPDPDPSMKVDDIRRAWVEFFPELSNAETKETKRGDDTVYTFTKRVGTKGGGEQVSEISLKFKIPNGKYCFCFLESIPPATFTNYKGEKVTIRTRIKDCPLLTYTENGGVCQYLMEHLQNESGTSNELKHPDCPNPEKK